MANFGDLLGGLMQNAMTRTGTGANRAGNAIQDLQANLGQMLQSQGGMSGLLGNVLERAKSTVGDTANKPAQAAGLGAVLGGLLGGGGSAVSGAVKGGALALLAGIAYKALQGAGQGAQGAAAGQPRFTGGAVPVGVKAPETEAEAQVLAHHAELVVRGMLNAAKADGEVSAEEIVRIVGKLKEAGMDDDAEAWIMAELRKPLDLDAFVAEIPNREAAAEIYAASLLAIEIDTPEERAYLSDLAAKSGLDPQVVKNIQDTVGIVV